MSAPTSAPARPAAPAAGERGPVTLADALADCFGFVLAKRQARELATAAAEQQAAQAQAGDRRPTTSKAEP